MKTCKRCKVAKELDQFSPHKTTTDRLMTYCRPCNSQRTRDYQKKNPETYENGWRSQGVKRHGIALAQFEQLLAKQGGVCKICKRPKTEKRLSIDHDHACCKGKYSCGKCIRGLLCMSCNILVGHIEKGNVSLKDIESYMRHSYSGYYATLPML